MLRLVSLMLFLAASSTLAVAGDSEDCSQNRDLDRQIAGCTSFINRAAGGKEGMASAYTNRANAYDEKGDSQRALRDYNEAIRINPDHPFAYYNRGLFYGHHGDNEHAIADYTEAIRLKPNFGDAFKSRGAAYFSTDQPSKAAADWVKAAELGVDPTNPNPQTPYGR
jgi:tetratricopeptide (TPR) repeat protein